MSANELSALLWRERELLEELEYRLETEQLLLSTGTTKWVQRATDDVGAVSDRLREANLARDVALVGLAEEWGLDENVSLRQIIEGAPADVWVDIFNGHLIALVQLSERIKAARDANLLLLRTAARSTHETLASIDSTAGTYDARGHAGNALVGARMIDKEI